MTVAELIQALQAHPPGKSVKVCLRRTMFLHEQGEAAGDLTELDADEADEVRNEGAFVLIWGGKP